MELVVQSRPRMLNSEQFDAIKAGDWFCKTCPDDRGENVHLYRWSHELVLRDRRKRDRRAQSGDEALRVPQKAGYSIEVRYWRPFDCACGYQGKEYWTEADNYEGILICTKCGNGRRALTQTELDGGS